GGGRARRRRCAGAARWTGVRRLAPGAPGHAAAPRGTGVGLAWWRPAGIAVRPAAGRLRDHGAGRVGRGARAFLSGAGATARRKRKPRTGHPGATGIHPSVGARHGAGVVRENQETAMNASLRIILLALCVLGIAACAGTQDRTAYSAPEQVG